MIREFLTCVGAALGVVPSFMKYTYVIGVRLSASYDADVLRCLE